MTNSSVARREVRDVLARDGHPREYYLEPEKITLGWYMNRIAEEADVEAARKLELYVAFTGWDVNTRVVDILDSTPGDVEIAEAPADVVKR